MTSPVLMVRSLEKGSTRTARLRREGGVALIVTMMILILIVGLALSAMETTQRDQQVAGVQARHRVALQAAEAGLAAGLASLSAGPPTLASADYGDGTIHHGAQPSYRPDPNVADPIEYRGSMPVPGMSLNINGSGPKFQLETWRLRVEGSEPHGMTARVDASTVALWGN